MTKKKRVTLVFDWKQQKPETAYRSHFEQKWVGGAFGSFGKEKEKKSHRLKKDSKTWPAGRRQEVQLQLQWKKHLPNQLCFIMVSKIRHGDRRLQIVQASCQKSRRKQNRGTLRKIKVSDCANVGRGGGSADGRLSSLGLIATVCSEAWSQFICLCAATKVNTKLFGFVFGF